MINFFQIAPQDQSLYYLGTIFGLVGDLLPVQQAPLLLSIMFKFINTVALSIGAALVIYVTVVGLLKTAAEGEFLGRQWNSLWVPIRTVLGIAALFPTATGYSAIQVIIMWIVLQGVGAADTLWTTIVNFTAVAGSPYASVSIPGGQITTDMQTLFQSLVCQASARADYPIVQSDPRAPSIRNIYYYCERNPSDSFCARGQGDILNIINGPQAANNRYSMGPGAVSGSGGACGTLTYCDETAQCQQNQSDLACIACKTQKTVLQSIIQTVLGPMAQQFVNIDYQYLQFFEIGGAPPAWATAYCAASGISSERCCVVSPLVLPGQPAVTCAANFVNNLSDVDENDPTNANASTGAVQNLYLPYPITDILGSSDINFVNTATNQYITTIVGAVSAQLSNVIANTPPAGASWQQEAKNNGWLLAGSYYYDMYKMNANNLDKTTPLLKMEGRDPRAESGNAMRNYRNNYSAVGNLLTTIQTQTQDEGPTFSLPPQFSQVSTQIGVTSSSLMHTFMENLSGHAAGSGDVHSANPLPKIALFGYRLMITAHLLFAVLLATAVGLTAAFTINPIALGTGLTMSPMGEAVKAAVGLVTPFIFVMIGSLYSLGALLGIYVHLIPFVIFTVGVIGWFIAVIEVMVAAPIVALGILSPGGQHDILGRAEPALMLVFNLFLRPVLMVFGLMAAMLLSVVVVNLINAGFLAVMEQIISHPGLFEQILFIAAYVSLLVTALNKTFSLIYMIPERVLTYIGGHK